MKKTLKLFDLIIEKTGQWLCYILAIIMFFTFTEVVFRYVFNAPTKWIYDVNNILMTVLITTTIAYSIKHGHHVSMDIVYRKFSSRNKLILDIIITVIMLFCFIFFLYIFTLFAIRAINTQEMLQTNLKLPAYHLKVFMVIGPFLLVVQGFKSLAISIEKLKKHL